MAYIVPSQPHLVTLSPSYSYFLLTIFLKISQHTELLVLLIFAFAMLPIGNDPPVLPPPLPLFILRPPLPQGGASSSGNPVPPARPGARALSLAEPGFACLSRDPDGIQGETDQQGAQYLQQKQTQMDQKRQGKGGFLVV